MCGVVSVMYIPSGGGQLVSQLGYCDVFCKCLAKSEGGRRLSVQCESRESRLSKSLPNKEQFNPDNQLRQFCQVC